MDGFLCVNKPQGPSSFQIIDQLRRILHIKKIGHAGTLDPQASGLLVVAIGAATRLLQYIPAEPKIYQFGIQFGCQTDTLDCEGEITVTGGSIPNVECINAILNKYSGVMMQIPPAYSAIKINGVRAYKMARSGTEVKLEPREIQIFSIEMIEYDSVRGCARMQVSCSGGTYVRALARDIASDLGTCGYASFVNRIGIGDFSLSDSIDADKLSCAENYIIPLNKIFDKNLITVTEEQKKAICNGKDLLIDVDSSDRLFAFFDGAFIAVLKRIDASTFHPVTVLACAQQVKV